MFTKVKRRSVSLIIGLVSVLLSLFLSAAPAQAITQLHLEFAQVQAGEPDWAYPDTPCSASSSNYWENAITGSFTDSNGNQYQLGQLSGYNSDGTWDKGPFVMPTGASLGTGNLVLQCKAASITVMTYDPIPVEVIANTTQIAFTAGEPRPEEKLTISSVTPCPAQSEVHVRVYTEYSYNIDSQGVTYSDAQGNWSYVYTAPRMYFTTGVSFFVRAGCYYPAGESHYTSLKGVWDSYRYVALGDSYSSGLGDGPDGPYEQMDADCHRSPNAYPYNVGARIGLPGPPQLIACAGSQTDDLYNGSFRNQQFFALMPDTKLVTLTIGGNDVGFQNVLNQCVSTIDPFNSGGINLGYNCKSDSAMTTAVDNAQAALAGLRSATAYGDSWNRPIHSIKDVLTQITTLSPNAEVYISGYPHLFGNSTSNFQSNSLAPSHYICNVNANSAATIRYDFDDAQWMNDQVDKINLTINQAVQYLQGQGKHVHYVDAATTFAHHGLCDDQDSWINGVYLDGADPLPWSFHPTTVGISSGFGTAFVNAM